MGKLSFVGVILVLGFCAWRFTAALLPESQATGAPDQPDLEAPRIEQPSTTPISPKQVEPAKEPQTFEDEAQAAVTDTSNAQLEELLDSFPKELDYFDDNWCTIDQLDADSREIAEMEFNDWRESHGHVEHSVLQNYRNYDRETLRTLAENGDFAAMTVIHQMTRRNRNKFDQEAWQTVNEQQFVNAAAQGNTQAYSWMARFYRTKMWAADRDGSEGGKEALLEMLAHHRAAALQGDSTLLLEGLTYLFKNSDYELNNDDKAWIDDRAQSIYEQVQTKRQQKGLPPIDTSSPPLQNRFNQLINEVLTRLELEQWQSPTTETDDCQLMFTIIVEEITQELIPLSP